MKLMLLSLLTLTFNAHAWTLNNNFGASFKDNNVKVKVAGNSTCSISNAGVTAQQLEAMIGPAVDKFWNEVPTSALKLESAGFSGNIANIIAGRLCSPTDDACITAAGGNLIPPVTDIIISCNVESTNFGGTGVLAVTVPNKFSGKKIAGAVILINDYSPAFGNLSYDDKIAVLAHEIGHAIGLGHSEEKSALMYYRTTGLRKNLAQDDIDGVTYLYPVYVDAFGLAEGGILGGCGTIKFNDHEPPKDPPFVQMAITLMVLVAMFEARRLLKRKRS